MFCVTGMLIVFADCPKTKTKSQKRKKTLKLKLKLLTPLKDSVLPFLFFIKLTKAVQRQLKVKKRTSKSNEFRQCLFGTLAVDINCCQQGNYKIVKLLLNMTEFNSNFDS